MRPWLCGTAIALLSLHYAIGDGRAGRQTVPTIFAASFVRDKVNPESKDPIAEAARSVVTIRVGGGVGSGVVVSSDGHIISNYHVVCPRSRCANTVKVRFNSGIISEGRVVAKDKQTDLSKIKVNETGLPFLSFDSAIVKGQEVVAIGSPLGQPDVRTEGRTLSLPGEPLEGDRTSPWHFLHSAEIKPGNSGGAVVSITPEGEPRLKGINVGVPSGKKSPSIAIAASEVERFYKENQDD